MTRLSDACVVTLEWDEDDDGNITAEGHMSYDIDADTNDVAMFGEDGKCSRVVEASDLPHAVSIVIANESVCSYNKRIARLSELRGCQTT